MDVSVYGILVESPSAIAVGTKVRAKLQPTGIEGETIVRHCRQNGPWFRIGLKLVQALLLEENVPNIEASLIK